ncbi:hypothetical protein RFI_15276 [Reticulomyxa filosa]|uniref:Uncharacterized protein n=1 Tax=Reticulomyxa filosa TaxID=46433 RepID=X6N7Q8_RETFI|nr:hypothetical protein RFI_15276 [Reticulomyxa filosa]|eukprot:ETO21928.1 hypothetical protein RFI_15276 [Reticulomyxa filosa]
MTCDCTDGNIFCQDYKCAKDCFYWDLEKYSIEIQNDSYCCTDCERLIRSNSTTKAIESSEDIWRLGLVVPCADFDNCAECLAENVCIWMGDRCSADCLYLNTREMTTTTTTTTTRSASQSNDTFKRNESTGRDATPESPYSKMCKHCCWGYRITTTEELQIDSINDFEGTVIADVNDASGSVTNTNGIYHFILLISIIIHLYIYTYIYTYMYTYTYICIYIFFFSNSQCPNTLVVYMQLKGCNADTLRSYENLLGYSIGESLNMSYNSHLIEFFIIENVANDAKVEVRFTITLTPQAETHVPQLLSNDTFVTRLDHAVRSHFSIVSPNIAVLDVMCLRDDCYYFENTKKTKTKHWYIDISSQNFITVFISFSLLTVLFVMLCFKYPIACWLRAHAIICPCTIYFPSTLARREFMEQMTEHRRRLERVERRRILLHQINQEINTEMDNSDAEDVEAEQSLIRDDCDGDGDGNTFNHDIGVIEEGDENLEEN